MSKSSRSTLPFYSDERIKKTHTLKENALTRAYLEKGEICYTLAESFRSQNEKVEFVEKQLEYNESLRWEKENLVEQDRIRLKSVRKYRSEFSRRINTTARFYHGKNLSKIEGHKHSILSSKPADDASYKVAVKTLRRITELRNLDDTISMAPRFSFPIYVYRGLSANPMRDLYGDILHDTGYKSTSLKHQICFNFGDPKKKKIYLQIKIPPHQPVYWLTSQEIRRPKPPPSKPLPNVKENPDFYIQGGESEILLGRNVEFRPIQSKHKVMKDYEEFLKSDESVFYLNVLAVYK